MFPVHERSYYNPAMIVIVFVAVADAADVVVVADDDFYLLLCEYRFHVVVLRAIGKDTVDD